MSYWLCCQFMFNLYNYFIPLFFGRLLEGKVVVWLVWSLLITTSLIFSTMLTCRWMAQLAIYPQCKSAYFESWKQSAEHILWYFNWQSARSNEVQVLVLDQWARWTLPWYGFAGTFLLQTRSCCCVGRSVLYDVFF